ncbi:GNAT family N-acetyltransferase [Microaerobacter geothermalis]|uniref:GNAT family N-acetyltransferase n=1 Tax=Microaerobacter geothermalis TaxID=674972 RepID=UPI001F26A8EF|nr:N-acetyltransferase [Microaerobacter geothermalis]MCF6095260.1 GNAT family N-acetyltransferase [Microaerobacter geothermalis]
MNNYLVEIVNHLTLDLLIKMVEIESLGFGSNGGLDEWGLSPLVRYGRVYILKSFEKEIGLAEVLRCFENPNEAYIYGVSIIPNYRGKGLGKFFVQHIIKDLSDMNFRRIVLTVSEENKSAIHLYTSLGFSTVDYLKDEYGKGIHRIKMCLDLS